MPFVGRDAAGAVVAVEAQKSERCPHYMAADNPELAAFLERIGLGSGARDPQNLLTQSDLEMSRVLEDLVDLLIRKGVLDAAELPATAREKLTRRRELRGHLKWLADIVCEDKVI